MYIVNYNAETELSDVYTLGLDVNLDEPVRAYWIEPLNHENGCMQDIHWFDGAWGYFPSYSMGAITAAQFFNTAINP